MKKELELKNENLQTNLKPYINKKNLYDIIPSPKNTRYRNNIMFSMGKNSQGEIEVGPFESIKCISSISRAILWVFKISLNFLGLS